MAVTCKELVEFLDRHLAGELTLDLRQVFDEHLAQCPSCTRYLRSYRATVALAAYAAKHTDAPPREFPAALLGSILSARRATKR